MKITLTLSCLINEHVLFVFTFLPGDNMEFKSQEFNRHYFRYEKGKENFISSQYKTLL